MSEEMRSFPVEILTGLFKDPSPNPRLRRIKGEPVIVSASKASNVVFDALGVAKKVGGATKLANSLFTGVDTDEKFTGSGLDDLTPGGDSTAIVITNYKVEIDGTGTPDTFRWSDDGGSTWDVSTVAITGSAQTLNNGVTVTFGATTGHTLTDYWEFNAGPQNILGLASSRLGGTDYIVGASAVELKSLQQSGGTWTSTEISGDWQPACTIDRRWQFVTLKDQLIASDFGQSVMYKWTGTGDVAVLDISGTGITTLKARYLTIAGDFLLFAYTDEDATVYRNHIWWSNGGDPESYASTNWTNIGGDEGDIITGIIGLEDIVLVFKRNSIWAGTFYGTDDGFIFRKVVAGIGNIAPSGLVVDGNKVYFIHYDGIYVFEGLPEPRRVSDPFISRYFTQGITEDKAEQMWGFKHPLEPYIMFYSQDHPTIDDPTLMYNTRSGDWTHAQFLFGAVSDARDTRRYTFSEVHETFGSKHEPFATAYNIDGGIIILGGDSNGDVLQMDQGSYVVDTTALDYVYKTNLIDCDRSRQNKRFLGLKILAKPTDITLTIRTYIDGSLVGGDRSLTIPSGSDDYVELPLYFDEVGKHIQLEFVNSSTTESVELNGFTIYYELEEDIL